MFIANVGKNLIDVIQTEPMTSGSSKVYLTEFHFSDEWDDLMRTAVFRASGMTVDVLLDESNVCFIPWEVLAKPGVPVYFGVYGTMGEDVVLPTIWAQTANILEGVRTGVLGREPTPDIYQQILAKLSDVVSPLTNQDLEAILT